MSASHAKSPRRARVVVDVVSGEGWCASLYRGPASWLQCLAPQRVSKGHLFEGGDGLPW